MESVYSSDRGGLTALVSQTDVGKLSDRELDDRLAALGRERCRVEALLFWLAVQRWKVVPPPMPTATNALPIAYCFKHWKNLSASFATTAATIPPRLPS